MTDCPRCGWELSWDWCEECRDYTAIRRERDPDRRNRIEDEFDAAVEQVVNESHKGGEK